MKRPKMRALILASCLGLITSPLSAQDTPPVAPTAEYAPYPAQDFPNQVFFGDTHLHTTYSADAGLIGNTLGPDEAYRFAKGETVTSSTRVPARLARPLDFLVVADHAENLGTAPLLAARDPRLLETDYGRDLLEAVDAGDLPRAWEIFSLTKASGEDPLADVPGVYDSVWQEITSAAERHNQPGFFTAFIGFEWTSAFERSNLHRNVIYRGGKETAGLFARTQFTQGVLDAGELQQAQRMLIHRPGSPSPPDR